MIRDNAKEKDKKDEKVKQRRNPYNLFSLMKKQQNNRISRGLLNLVRTFIVLVIVFCLIWFITSGVINQRETGQKFVDWSLDKAKKIGTLLKDIITGDGPVKLTKDGVYRKDVDIPKD